MPGRMAPVSAGRQTFAGAPRCDDLGSLDADVAVLGVPVGVPYPREREPGPCADAPAAVRAASRRWVGYVDHHDWDLGGDLFAGRDVRLADCGDVPSTPGHHAENSAATTAAVAAILGRGAVPVVLGGDDSVPIPVLRAYEGRGSLCVVQIDAHLDWRDEVDGVREGLSSPMRRASELPWVAGMAQVGLRGVGSGRREELDAAQAFGSALVGAEEVRRVGVEGVLCRIPAAERYFVTLDMDGFDPAIAPGVGYPAFGGLAYWDVFGLLRGLAATGRIVGMDVVELVPARDVRDLTRLLAAQLVLNLVGVLAHAGQIGRER